ncbi:MAG: elongation factor P [Acidobacteria bacterium]|nr:elongation factor P [Acidobacteriota bacterium]
MILASQLRPGTVVRIGEELFKVIESTYHVGQGKMPGSVHAKLKSVLKGTFKELRWRPEERVEDVQLIKQDMEYLYSDADSACFMNPVTYDQVAIPLEVIGPSHKFLKTEMMIAVEFYEAAPVNVVFPPAVEIRVDTTAEPVHQQQDNTYKFARLENGMEVMVPQFIRPGEVVRIDVATGKYLDRVRTDIKRV